MIKRTVSVSLALTLVLTLLTGCGAGGGAGGATAMSTGTVELPAQAREYGVSSNVTAAVLQQYISARMKLEQLTQAKTAEEFGRLIGGTIKAFQYADQFAEKAIEYADYAALANEDSPQATGVILETKTAQAQTSLDNPFISAAYAADDKPFDAKAWAEDLTKKFDEGKPGQQVRNLAEQLGVDAKEAYNQLKAAQDIIKKGADADAAFFDTAMKAAMATKTACKVGMLVTGTIATAGGLGGLATGYVSASEAAVFMVNSVDCIVDIGVTASTIIVGEDHKLVADLNAIADKIAPVTTLMGLHGLLTTDFSLLGKSAKITDETIGLFDFVGQSLADYAYSGKVVALDASGKADGKTQVKATAIDIPQTSEGKVDAEKLNNTLEKANLAALTVQGSDPKPIGQVLEDFEKAKPDPVNVLKQIDEALAELESLLVELGKISAAPDIEGTYSGSYDQSGGISRLSGKLTVAMSLSDKSSDTYTAKLTIYYPKTTHNYVFKGQVKDGHFQSPKGTSTYKYDTGVSLALNFSEAGDSLGGTMTRHSALDGKTSTYTLAIKAAKQ